MIATAEEYLQQIWRLYDGNVPQTAIILPSDEVIYEIDLDTRTIKSPYLLGITKDQAAETLYFVVDRFHGEIDLANTACIVYYKNAQGGTGFYPVPFYDTTTFSSLVTLTYIKAHVTEATYEKNVYYIKQDEDYILCNDDKFNETLTYYQYNDTSIHKKYTKVDLTENQYKAGIYYIINLNGVYEISTGNFDKNIAYYVKMDQNYINAHVEYSNYKPNFYYTINNNGEFELATGSFDKTATYYTILDTPKILFPWAVGNVATAEIGELEFAVRFYKIQNDQNNEAKLVYNLSTKPATTRVLEGLDVEISDEQFETDLENPPDYWQFISPDATILEDIYYRLSLATNNDIYWIEA